LERGELAPAFLFRGSISAFATPKQARSRPLESISYELLHRNVFENSFWLKHFHIRCKMMGGWEPLFLSLGGRMGILSLPPEKKWRPRKQQPTARGTFPCMPHSTQWFQRQASFAWHAGA